MPHGTAAAARRAAALAGGGAKAAEPPRHGCPMALRVRQDAGPTNGGGSDRTKDDAP